MTLVYICFQPFSPANIAWRFKREGFKQAEVVKLTVNVGDQLQNNFKLEVGSVKEAVTVESESSLVDTLSSTVSSVVTGAPY